MNMHVSTAKFKVGDRVRCDDNRGAPSSYKVGEVYEVESVDRDMVRCKGVRAGMFEWRFSPSTPTFKIGDRVQGAELDPEDNPGTINGFDGQRYSVKWDSESSGAKYYMWAAEDLYLLPAPTPLKIEAGKFYKTRDGRKVGPVVAYLDGDFIIKFGDGNIWRGDGKAAPHNTDKSDLIAEWPTSHACAAAQVDNLRDEYGPVGRAGSDKGLSLGDILATALQKPKFKIGDRVRVLVPEWDAAPVGSLGTITTLHDHGVTVRIDGGDGFAWFFPFRAVTAIDVIPIPTTPAIVCLIEDGQPKPATHPHVHPSRSAASDEASRLARVHPGKEFGVFEMVDTRKHTPNYAQPWQNFAAAGRKIDAIKELRGLADIGLAAAKTEVERWINIHVRPA